MNKLILADDQDIFRAGLARLLAMEEDCRIIAQCNDTERLARAVESYCGATTVVASTLLLRSPGLATRIQKNNGHCIAIAEARESADTFLAHEIQGVVYRSASAATVLDCLRRVRRGEQNVKTPANDTGLQTEDEVGGRVRQRLTSKELKILSLIMQGCKNREAGVRLGTSEQVVKNHLRDIFDKVGVSDRLELALFTVHHPTLAAAVASVQEM